MKNSNQTHSDPISIGNRNENPNDISFWNLIKEDYKTHNSSFLEVGFWPIFNHRLGNWRMGIKNRYLRFPFTLIYRFFFHFNKIILGIELSYIVQLGRRVRIWHQGGLIINARSIGNDVHIRHNTTIGILKRNATDNRPIIEDRVELGCGVAILGSVTVGHDSIVGANAVVIQDIPPFSVAVGIPAKVVKTITPDCDIADSNSLEGAQS
jgi:serine O-acetyltransferase